MCLNPKAILDMYMCIIFQLSIPIPEENNRIYVSIPDSSSKIAQKLMVHGVYQDQIRFPVYNTIVFIYPNSQSIRDFKIDAE